MTEPFIVKRKIQNAVGNDSSNLSLAQSLYGAGEGEIYRIITASDALPVLTLKQLGSGYNLLLQAPTPEIRFDNLDQVDPIGQYRMRVIGDYFVLERATTADWAAQTEVLSVDPSSNFVKLSAIGDTDHWLGLYAGIGATQSRMIMTPGQGLRIHTGDGSSSAATRITFTDGSAICPMTIGYAYFAWSQADYREFLYNNSTNDDVERVLDLTHNTSNQDGAENGIGAGLGFRIETTTTDRMLAGMIECLWTDATHATRVADMVFKIDDDSDYVFEEYMRFVGATKTISVNSHKITNLTDPTAAQDAVTKVYHDTIVSNLAEIDSTDNPYTAALAGVITVDSSGGAVTINLPAISGIAGRRYYIKVVDATNTITVDGNASETIDGELTQILHLYDCMEIVATSVEWSII